MIFTIKYGTYYITQTFTRKTYQMRLLIIYFEFCMYSNKAVNWSKNFPSEPAIHIIPGLIIYELGILIKTTMGMTNDP